MKYLQTLFAYLILLMLFNPLAGAANGSDNEIPDELPELEQINEILDAGEAPPGIVFVIYEYDESALTWIMPRLVTM